jgi:hypothetical protein
VTIEDGTITVRHGIDDIIILRAYGRDTDVSQSLADAYRTVQDNTGESPRCFVSPFRDDDGDGTEIIVGPSGEPIAAGII